MTRRRVLAAGLGLLLAAAAAWALATWPRPPPRADAAGARDAAEGGAPAPHADIDEASRRRLREVLEREDAREARERGAPEEGP